MTIDEFQVAIKGLPGDMEIIIAKDAEGNSYSPLSDIAVGIYTPETTWQGDFTTWADEEGQEEISEADCNALCLQPTN